MSGTFLLILGIILLLAGGLVTILFWIPKIVNRPRLREILGPRYPIIFLIYAANGPFLALLGLLILMVFGEKK